MQARAHTSVRPYATATQQGQTNVPALIIAIVTTGRIHRFRAHTPVRPYATPTP
ncbi:MAG: hypothetical protein L6435_18025 [Anaerolineae bacterium]|nr:hypothetical protein [Anaerolineae bacterium]